MRADYCGSGVGRILVPVCLCLWALHGCSVVGPMTISHGRPAYNEAISRTDDQQLLMTIVRNRYGETSTMLAVTSVTANLRFGASAGVQLGFGDEADFAGNLVPFSAGITYEENPTIVYTPVQGEQYIRQLLSPIPLDLLVLFLRSVEAPGALFTLLVSRVNAITNPDFLASPAAPPDPRFTRLVELLTVFDDAGVLDWVEDKRPGSTFSVILRGYAPRHTEVVRELLGLLGLPVPAEMSRDLVLPLSLAVVGAKPDGMAITTRSIFDVMEILSAAIEGLEEHVRSGLAMRYPPLGLAGRHLRIRRLAWRPRHASVVVKYRGAWFSIDETDQSTKQSFRLLSALWSVRIANAAAGAQPAPVLTVPVSR